MQRGQVGLRAGLHAPRRAVEDQQQRGRGEGDGADHGEELGVGEPAPEGAEIAGEQVAHEDRRKPDGDLLAEMAERHETDSTAYRGEVVPYFSAPENEDVRIHFWI